MIQTYARAVLTLNILSIGTVYVTNLSYVNNNMALLNFNFGRKWGSILM